MLKIGYALYEKMQCFMLFIVLKLSCFLLFCIQVMIYLIDKVLPESYFANNLRALSGKHNETHTQVDPF